MRAEGVADAWATDARKVAHSTDPSACTSARLQQSPLARLNGSQAVAITSAGTSRTNLASVPAWTTAIPPCQSD
jgi:hypothetical protein